MNAQSTYHASIQDALSKGKKVIERPFLILMIASSVIIAGLFALRFFTGLFDLSNVLIPIYGILVLVINQIIKTKGSYRWQKWVLTHVQDLHSAEREGIRRNWLTNKGLRDQAMLKRLSTNERLAIEKRLAKFHSQNQNWQDVSEIPWEVAYFVEQKQVKKEIQSLGLMILAPLALYGFLWMNVAGYLIVKAALGAICLVYVSNFLRKIFHYRSLALCDEPMLAANSEEIKYYNGKQATHLPWRNLESVLLQGKDLKVIYNEQYLQKHPKKDRTEHLDLKFLYIPNQENFESLLDFYQQRFIKYRQGETEMLV